MTDDKQIEAEGDTSTYTLWFSTPDGKGGHRSHSYDPVTKVWTHEQVD